LTVDLLEYGENGKDLGVSWWPTDVKRDAAALILLTTTTHIFPCRRCFLVRWWVGLSPPSHLTCLWKYKLVTFVIALWVMSNLISLF